MDIQRLIAFVVFSFSALLLWDAWQKHNAPRTPPAAVATTATPGAAPTPSTSLTPAVPSAGTPATATAPPAPAGAALAGGGESILVKTDMFDVELNTAGGDIRRVKLHKVFSALDRTKPLTLLEPDPKQFFVTQSGLLGEGLPNHKTSYAAEAKEFSLAQGKDTLEVRLVAKDSAGVEVTKTLSFRRAAHSRRT